MAEMRGERVSIGINSSLEGSLLRDESLVRRKKEGPASDGATPKQAPKTKKKKKKSF